MKELSEANLIEVSGGNGETGSFGYDLFYCVTWGITAMSIVFGRNAMKGMLAFK